MPMFEFRCLNGHSRDAYAHNVLERACHAVICEQCRNDMAPVLSLGRGLTWFEEGRARVITNMGHEPVTITSHEQHKKEMKRRGLDWAPPRRGMPGCWS